VSFHNHYPNRKDHRKPYTGAKRIDPTCKNGGACTWCRGNRMYSTNKWKMAALDQHLDAGGDEIHPEPGTEAIPSPATRPDHD